MKRELVHIPGLAAAAVLAFGCTGAGATSSPKASPTPSPTASPTPNPEFKIYFYPAEDPVEARVAIPGEKVSFLVVATSPGNDALVEIGATAMGATITDIKPTQLKPGMVGEIWLVPGATTVDAADSLGRR